MSISSIRRKDMKLDIVNGFAKTELLPGVFDHVKPYRCVLQAGKDITQKAQENTLEIYCFTDGKGYVTTPQKAFMIEELSFFSPKPGEAFTIHAASDMEYTVFVIELIERDMEFVGKSHLVLPYFKRLSDADEYWQDCKTEGTRSWSIITGKQLFPIIMGVVKSGSGGTIEKGHPKVAQWNVILEDSEITLTVEKESIEQKGGDFSYITAGLDHSLVATPGKKLSYIWFEYFV